MDALLIFYPSHVSEVTLQRVWSESALWKLRCSAARFVDSHHASSGIFQYTSLRPQEGYMVPTFQVFSSPPTTCLRRAGDEVPNRRVCVHQWQMHQFEAGLENPAPQDFGSAGLGAFLKSFQGIV